MIAILATHPIQYQTPIWRMLAARARAPVKVFYLSHQGLACRRDPGFGRAFAWDVDLLDGYEHEFARVREARRQDSFFWLSLAENLPRRMKADGARVLWLQGWQTLAYWQAAALARAAGLPVWMRGETNDLSAGRGPLRRLALAALFSRVDRFLCIGSANRDYYLSRGVAAERLAPAPYCVDNAELSRAADALRPMRARLREAFGIPRDAFCVAFVGKLLARKRPFDLVDAARALNFRGQGQPVHLLFVGDGELRTQLQAECPEASFAGFLNQSRIAEAYVAADCLALPSEASETWGLVVNEAMASGLPAVVSDACGCAADLVRPYWPELTHRCGDALGLARALAAARAAPPAPPDLRAAIARHDPLLTVETVERCYAELLRSPVPRSAYAGLPKPHAPDPRRA